MGQFPKNTQCFLPLLLSLLGPQPLLGLRQPWQSMGLPWPGWHLGLGSGSSCSPGLS